VVTPKSSPRPRLQTTTWSPSSTYPPPLFGQNSGSSLATATRMFGQFLGAAISVNILTNISKQFKLIILKYDLFVFIIVILVLGCSPTTSIFAKKWYQKLISAQLENKY
jgi:hypothetical protein